MLSVAISLIVGLVLMQYAHGQVSDRPNPLRELMDNGVVTADNEYQVFIPPTAELMQQINTIDEINTILDYCYQHADNANPVQELVNKGLVSSGFNVDTCGSIKQKHDNITLIVSNIENQIREKGCFGEGCVPNYRLK
jgi:hypothetical protein